MQATSPAVLFFYKPPHLRYSRNSYQSQPFGVALVMLVFSRTWKLIFIACFEVLISYLSFWDYDPDLENSESETEDPSFEQHAQRFLKLPWGFGNAFIVIDNSQHMFGCMILRKFCYVYNNFETVSSMQTAVSDSWFCWWTQFQFSLKISKLSAWGFFLCEFYVLTKGGSRKYLLIRSVWVIDRICTEQSAWQGKKHPMSF